MTDLSAPRVPGERLDMPKGQSRRAVRTARTHSLFVRYLRHFIIIGSSIAVLGVGFIVMFDPFKKIPRNLSVRSVGLHGTIVTLQTPKMRGFRQDGEPFELNGLSGTQDITKPDIVNLVGVNAKLGLADKSTTLVTARSGVYDNHTDIVLLHDDVVIKNHQSGYEMRLKSARVNFKSNELITQEPVAVILDGGSAIAANAMDVTDNGHKISFHGGVVSHVNSGGSASDNGQTETAE